MLRIEQSLELNYLLEGSGTTTLLFFNGATLPLAFWDKLCGHLHNDYQLLRFDQRNAGATKFTGSFSLNDICSDVAALLKHLNIDQVIPVGHAWGGRVAQVFARDYAHLCQALIICGTGGQRPASVSQDTLTAMHQGMKNGQRQQWEDALADAFCGAALRQQQPQEFAEISDLLWNSSSPRGAKWDASISPSNSYWGSCGKPTLLLYGEEDKYGTAENAHDLQQKLTQSNLRFIADAGHFVVREQAKLVADLIQQFIDSLQRL